MQGVRVDGGGRGLYYDGGTAVLPAHNEEKLLQNPGNYVKLLLHRYRQMIYGSTLQHL